MSSGTTPHIRPRARTTTRKKTPPTTTTTSNKYPDIKLLVAETQGILDSWGLGTKHKKVDTKKNAIVIQTNNIVKVAAPKETTAAAAAAPKVKEKNTTTVAAVAASKSNNKTISFKKTIASTSKKVSSKVVGAEEDPKSILRKPKYKKTSEPAVVVVKEEKRAVKEEKRAVKEKVVERTTPSRRRKKGSSKKKNDHLSVEGYTPQTEKNENFSLITPEKKKKNNNKVETTDDPFSLEQKVDTTHKVVETDLEFSVLSAQEYREQQKEDEDQKIHTIVSEDDVDDDNDNDDGDEDDFEFDYWNNNDEDDVEHIIDILPAPEPRAFMKLWSALSELVTPEACRLVNSWQQQQKQQQNNDDNDEYSTTPSSMNSDIAASRCAGLMSLLNMHFQRCYNNHDSSSSSSHTIKIKHRLGQLVRTFHYSRPTPKLNNNLCRAMTCILLAVVLNNDNNDYNDAVVPESAKAVGITMEEYTYLTKSYFKTYAPP